MDAITTTSFSAVLDGLTEESGVFRTTPSSDWRQGRTLFGGLSAALAVASARRAFADLPPLRAAQFTFIGPASGALDITPRLLRAGKSASFVEVTARSESDIALNATLVFAGGRRSSHCYRDLPMPEVSPPDSLSDFFTGPVAPVFARQFEGRFAGGAHVVSGAARPELLLWLRHRDPAAPDDATSIVALGDMPPPAAMTLFTTPAPISTVTWSLELLAERFTGAGWHLVHVLADTVGQGYSSQRMTLWDAGGAPLITARQTVAVFG